MGRRTFLTGRETELKVGVSQYSENRTSLEVTGRIGVGTTNASCDLDVVGNAQFHGEVRDYLNNMGASRAVLTSTGSSVFWDAAFDPNALNELKQAHAEKDIDRCKSAIENLNNVFGAAATEMYNASSTEGQPTANTGAQDAEVTDVDFEEVKDDKK